MSTIDETALMKGGFIMSIENRRIRNFAFIFYLDLSPLDWESRLINLHLPGYYICHNKDLNADNTPKKPHIHVLIATEGLHTLGKIKRISEHVGGKETVYQEVNSLRGYARYLCHLDDPLKHKYELNEVKSMGGCNYTDYISPNDKIVEMTAEIIKYCQDNKIYVYADLIDYCMTERSEWFEFLCNKQQGKMILEYMKSRYWANTSFSAPERSEGY